VLFLLVARHAGGADIPWVWHSSHAPDQVTEIALLLDHLILSGETVQTRHRMRRIDVDEGVRVTPVVHVQSDMRNLPALNAKQTQVMIDAVKMAARRSTSGWIQLDFEAMESQKTYYVGLISRLRRELSPSTKLSVTTLASWCFGNNPLKRLEAEEIVPMFFRMGLAGRDYRQALITTPEKLDPSCREQAIGLAVQEAPPPAVQQRYKRRYWFNYKNWNHFSKGE